MDDPDDLLQGYKLCGYLIAVVTAPSSDTSTLSIPSLSLCHVISDKHNVGFKTHNGVVLSPIHNPVLSSRNGDASSSGGRSSRKRRLMGIGLVNGSLSVVHQIHALVVNKTGVEVIGRVLRAEVGRRCEVRVVVMVDVYLSSELWCGWQFPKLGSVAGSLFKHLSCNWEGRSAALKDSRNQSNIDGVDDTQSIWTISDCHVLGCKLHCNDPDPSRRRDFELHEIFKNLPSVASKLNLISRVQQANSSFVSGIWDITDDILVNILSVLGPKDLASVAATCHHLRYVAVSIMPCMKLKLFPHQQAAVEWMLQRERKAQVLQHPLYMDFYVEDGSIFYINVVTGEIVIGSAPTLKDFRGGMFCDEPGLGKTITALSLILKTQGKIAEPPEGTGATWCDSNQNRGYYELIGNEMLVECTILSKRTMFLSSSVGQSPRDKTSPRSTKRMRFKDTRRQEEQTMLPFRQTKKAVESTRSRSRIQKNLFTESREASKSMKLTEDFSESNETWVQCDSCSKWRRLIQAITDVTAAWFCSMNSDLKHCRCTDPQEDWEKCDSITYLPGFVKKGTSGEREQNVSFFVGVLKEHYSLINSRTRKALNWLAELSLSELYDMETVGLSGPFVGVGTASGAGDAYGYHKIFQAFGLIRRIEKGVCKWYYPCKLDNLEFDLAAFNMAMREPLDSVRFYLSRATLIVVPANLVDHWETQIHKHVKPNQLRVCIWTDLQTVSAHNLAWDYDIVITTFNRLSAEWSPDKKSPLMQVHWYRVLLDEGHTLGSSLSMTNKLHMAITLMASNRWLLTGTPTPNTPNSQLSHLQPMLHFLHEECYGLNQRSWEAGILKPFEAEMEEGRTRLLQLLHRCLISAKKVDLKTIPPCIKKVTFLNFTSENAISYNEMVVTVRRNILMADWSDPSHVESLLNPKQWKFRSSTIRNLRLSCCVAGHIRVSVFPEDVQETMDILVLNGLQNSSEQYSIIQHCIEFGGNCSRCNGWCRLPVVTPCAHLLCLDCVALSSERCTSPNCGYCYEMQAPEILTRPENPNPKWPVPKDLIELQPSYKQDAWHPDWQSTSSSKVAYLVERLRALQESDKHQRYFFAENGEKNMEEQLDLTQIGKETVTEKVIIFSQFLEHIHVIEHQLTIARISYATLYSAMHKFNKRKALDAFQNDDTCMALIMDGSAALGLDFSFVSHVFLMEPIWDKSVEEQVISRAHRMGATRPIYVETLVMRGTIEEQMVKFLEDDDWYGKAVKESKGKEGRPHRTLHELAEINYLAHINFVHTNSSY